MKLNNDSRTDNWAGRRDPGSDPRNYTFPRSAREAGFYYGPYKKDRSTLYAVLSTIILVGLIFWLG